jgi:hypothetical protein
MESKKHFCSLGGQNHVICKIILNLCFEDLQISKVWETPIYMFKNVVILKIPRDYYNDVKVYEKLYVATNFQKCSPNLKTEMDVWPFCSLLEDTRPLELHPYKRIHLPKSSIKEVLLTKFE